MALPTRHGNPHIEPLEVDNATGRPIWAKNQNGEAICGAKSRKVAGKVCGAKMPFLADNGRCRIHGGTIPKGIAHPHWGQRSKFAGALPPVQQEQLLTFLNNPDYLSLTEEIAFTDLEQIALLHESATIDNKAFPKLVDELQSLEFAIDICEQTGDYDELIIRARRCIQLGIEANKGRRIQSELRDTREHRRRLVETETNRLFKGRTQIPIDRVFTLVTSIGLCVKDAIEGLLPREYHRPLLVRIQKDVQRLVPIVGGGQPIPQPPTNNDESQ